MPLVIRNARKSLKSVPLIAPWLIEFGWRISVSKLGRARGNTARRSVNSAFKMAPLNLWTWDRCP